MFRMHYSKNQVYDYNVGILKQYGENHYRLINLKTLRKAGFEECNAKVSKRGAAGNTGKLCSSLARSKGAAFELAMCNPWEMFVTLTVKGAQHDRYDLTAVKGQLAKWINNMNFQKGLQVRYLLIPEQHKDGAWHFHGLMMGIPPEQLKPFTLQERIPRPIKAAIQKGEIIYNWLPYANSFGWVTVSPIIDRERCAKYILKYITKDLMQMRIALNSHVYLASQGLNRAAEIRRGPMERVFEPDFQNEYVRIKTFDNMQEPLSFFEPLE